MTESTENVVTEANGGTAVEADLEQSRHFHLAYARLKPTLDAIPPVNFVRITMDVGLVVQTVLGTLPELEKLKDAIIEECPRINPHAIANLKEAVLALGHLEVLKRGSKGQPGTAPGEPAARIRGVRDLLLADVQPLVARGLLDEKALLLTPGNSPRNTAFDVLRLVNYLDENWTLLQGRSLTTRADLESARSAAQDLITYLGVRDNTEGEEELNLMRQRAVTHLIDLYEELRWAVRYVRRRMADSDLIMPSLYTLRAKPRAGSAGNEETDAGDEATQPATHTAGDIDSAHLQAVMAGNFPGASPNTTSREEAAPPRTSGSPNPVTS